MSVAECTLESSDLLHERVEKVIREQPVSKDHFGYASDPHGGAEFRNVISELYRVNCLKENRLPIQIISFGAISGAKPVPAHASSINGFRENAHNLELAYNKALNEDNITSRVVIIVNPNNPMGIIHTWRNWKMLLTGDVHIVWGYPSFVAMACALVHNTRGTGPVQCYENLVYICFFSLGSPLSLCGIISVSSTFLVDQVFFVLISLRKYGVDTVEKEVQAFYHMLKHKIILNPGSALASCEFGWFRLVFSTVRFSDLNVAFEKLTVALDTIGFNTPLSS
eukprot:CFRG4790T1